MQTLSDGLQHKAWFLPNDRLAVATRLAIEIYTINDSNDKAILELLLLRRVIVHQSFISQPFVRHDGISFLCSSGDIRRVDISYDPAIPHAEETLGLLEYDPMDMRLGTFAAVIYRDAKTVDIKTHHMPAPKSMRLFPPHDGLGRNISSIVGFDENAGRIVLQEANINGKHRFSILDLIEREDGNQFNPYIYVRS